MTDEEINIAIAQYMGWKRPDDPDVMKFKEGWTMPEKWWMSPDGVLKFKSSIPDYCDDLNAMHEAENSLKENRKTTYAFVLAQLLKTHPTVDASDQYLNIHATARERAKAFLKTIGEWRWE